MWVQMRVVGLKLWPMCDCRIGVEQSSPHQEIEEKETTVVTQQTPQKVQIQKGMTNRRQTNFWMKLLRGREYHWLD